MRIHSHDQKWFDAAPLPAIEADRSSPYRWCATCQEYRKIGQEMFRDKTFESLCFLSNRRIDACLLLLLLLPCSLFAKPKSVVVLHPCAEVYHSALVKAGHDGYAVIEQDEKAMTFKLRPPHGGVIFHAYVVGFTPESEGKACRVSGDGHGSSNENRFLNQLAEGK